ncbi:hypothetical protein GGR58DRAFT_462561 [Xylaria digitata]|nr:hypothetical protein GGR58DRAFT_462561 [Xylaria digitata]
MAPSYPNRKASATEGEPLLGGSNASTGRSGGSCLIFVLSFAAQLVTGLYFFWLLVHHWNLPQAPPDPLPTYNVAIIGAGPAGISAAQHLRNSHVTRNVHLNITIYESKPILGGALALHGADGSSVYPKDDPMQSPITAEDVAGTALVWNNALFTRDSENVLQDKIDFTELGPEQIGYYKNTVKTVTASRPYSKTPMLTWVQLIWAYGSSVWRGDKLAQDGVLRRAMLKAPLAPNLEKIFHSLGILGPLQQRSSDMLKGRSISGRYAKEILEPQVQRAYGQSLNQVSGLAVMTAAAQEETANAYQGGYLIQRLRRIVDEIDVEVRTSTRVTGIKYVEVGENRLAWLIRHESADGDGGNSSIEVFDKVIVAALDFDIELENGDLSVLDLKNHYDIGAAEATMRNGNLFVPVHITLFTSDAKLSPWDQDEEVLFLEPQKAAGMRELKLVREIFSHHDYSTKTEYLYRVLSVRPVLGELKRRATITWSYETRIEKAYPVLFPLQRFPPFELPWAKGFWWTSIIQRAGTSVDLNWLAGKVAAQDLIKQIT